MRDLQSGSYSELRGQILVAHPQLRDPNFRESVVLLSAHSQSDGALGVILNRPTGRVLGDLKEDFRDHGLARIPVFQGGPVSGNELLLAAWRWLEEDGMFQLFFGVSAEKLLDLIDEIPGLETRAFAGYAGWSTGQLEGEMQQNSWVTAALRREYLDAPADTQWRTILTAEQPEIWGFLDEMPDDPSIN